MHITVKNKIRQHFIFPYSCSCIFLNNDIHLCVYSVRVFIKSYPQLRCTTIYQISDFHFTILSSCPPLYPCLLSCYITLRCFTLLFSISIYLNILNKTTTTFENRYKAYPFLIKILIDNLYIVKLLLFVTTYLFGML